MTKATEMAIKAICIQDGTIQPTIITAALTTLRGSASQSAAEKTADEVWTATQVAECLKKSKRMIIYYGDLGLITPVYGAGKHRIGYSRQSVMNFIAAGGRQSI